MANTIENIGEGIGGVIEPIADAIAPDAEKSTAFAIGFVSLLMLAIFFIFRKKLTPTKIRYRAKRATRRMYRRRSK